MAPQPPQLSEGIPQQKAGTDQGTFPPDPSDATPGVTPAPPPLSLLHQVPSRVPCLTPTPHTLTARQYFLTGSTPGFPRQSLRHLVPSFQLWHSNTRAQGREGPQQSEPWACLPLQPVHPFLTHPSCFSWSSGGICSGLLWVLQRFWVTATAHTPMAPQLQHHQSVSRETPKKSFQYTPAHLEAKATQSISQLSYASGVFTALHFMAQH